MKHKDNTFFLLECCRDKDVSFTLDSQLDLDQITLRHCNAYDVRNVISKNVRNESSTAVLDKVLSPVAILNLYSSVLLLFCSHQILPSLFIGAYGIMGYSLIPVVMQILQQCPVTLL